ncbi:MAG: tryptophan synthase subunit alpha [Smithellaceae bacterium]|nr:tryptophan synthase subunit alpha [Smithellaceae bacterium]
MGRIADKFHQLRKDSEKALVVYITAGDPDLLATEEIILSLERAGADIIEVGVPFSDPTADGPIIQAAAQRALRSGTNLRSILAMIKRVRQLSQIPIVLFGYYNPIHSFGQQAFATEAMKAGVDGILVVDLPPEEAQELRTYTDCLGLEFITLVAPTTDDQRVKDITKNAGGFVYYVSITGVTGTSRPSPQSIRKDVERIRRATNLPVVVGFGITDAAQAYDISRLSDGVVIGSALVRTIADCRQRHELAKKAVAYIKGIKKKMSES